jgi:hypothetical protein
MNWLDESGSERRPLVFVEDHLYHTADLLTAVREARPRLLDHVAVAVLDRPGPDTDAAVKSCAAAFPEVAIVTPSASDIANTASFSKWVGRRMRPGGILVQDVQLGTLPFIPADRWWESIYLAATIRGMFPERPLAVRFLSNKRGYGATFGGEMLEAGFDPRDVMEKTDLAGTVVPALGSLFDRQFPSELQAASVWPLGDSPADRRDVEESFDLILWRGTHTLELSGRAIVEPGRITLRPDSPESETWRLLIKSHLAGDDGMAVVDLGARVGPAQAERAELTNLAARHIHTLRSRLRSATDIATVKHAYRLNDRLRVGIVRPRVTFGAEPATSKVRE